MADVTISNLPPLVGSVGLSDVIPASQNGTTVKASVSQLLSNSLPLANGTNSGTDDFYLNQFVLTRPGFLLANGYVTATYSSNPPTAYIYAGISLYLSLVNSSQPNIEIQLGNSSVAGNKNFNSGLEGTVAGSYYCAPGTYSLYAFFPKRIASGSGTVTITYTRTSLNYIVIPASP